MNFQFNGTVFLQVMRLCEGLGFLDRLPQKQRLSLLLVLLWRWGFYAVQNAIFFMSAKDNSPRRRFFSVAALSSNIFIYVCSLLLLFRFVMLREWKGVLESENFLSLHTLNDRTSHVSSYLLTSLSVCPSTPGMGNWRPTGHILNFTCILRIL